MRAAVRQHSTQQRNEKDRTMTEGATVLFIDQTAVLDNTPTHNKKKRRYRSQKMTRGAAMNTRVQVLSTVCLQEKEA